MYPEIYKALQFRRGSQNRNFYNRVKDSEDYVSMAERSRARKKKRKAELREVKLEKAKEDGEATPATKPSATGDPKIIDPAPKKKRARASAEEKKATRQAKKAKKKLTGGPPLSTKTTPPSAELASASAALPFLSPVTLEAASPAPGAAPPVPHGPPSAPRVVSTPLPPSDAHDGADAVSQLPRLDGPASSPNKAEELRNDRSRDGEHGRDLPGPSSDSDISVRPNESTSNRNKRKKQRKQGLVAVKKKRKVVIDTQVLAAECVSGRYPSVKVFDGKHDEACTLCEMTGEDDDPLLNCDFCQNSFHSSCLDARMLQKSPQVIVRETEPESMVMCHNCINLCLSQRKRAEARRAMKWKRELSKAGLGHIPEAANLKDEVNLAANLKDEAHARDNRGTGDGREMGLDDPPTYAQCPEGGPGGLICCSYCTAAYSRLLSNTVKEMEAQSVASVGREVSEILDLLADAKQRLHRLTVVSEANEMRRDLLDKNESAHEEPSHVMWGDGETVC